jgi:hypothetical protein
MKGFEEKKEVLEGMSIDYCNSVTRLVRQEEEEGRSIDYSDIVIQ